MPSHEGSHDELVVDAIEGGAVATVEAGDGSRLVVPVAWLPAGTGEGDVVRVSTERSGGATTVRLELDPDATRERREAARQRRERLPKAPEGDLDL